MSVLARWTDQLTQHHHIFILQMLRVHEYPWQDRGTLARNSTE